MRCDRGSVAGIAGKLRAGRSSNNEKRHATISGDAPFSTSKRSGLPDHRQLPSYERVIGVARKASHH
tara:strand:+ start:63840 stop:64040 length:201 start_codon:yes stop_codon:yes gene_type:complete